MKTVGILGLQGAYAAHQKAIEACGAMAVIVRTPSEIEAVDGLIIPGGESTTMGLLLERFNLVPSLLSLVKARKPIFGTCAGMILLAKDIIGSDQLRLNLMDIVVERNAYGRQLESFTTTVSIPALKDNPFPAIFIRAPKITKVNSPDVEVLAEVKGSPVLVKQGLCLAAAFHPELSDDLAIHRYFLDLIES